MQTNHQQTQSNATKQPNVTASFSHFNLPQALNKALADLGFKQPTPVQAHTIQPALAGQDLMVSAQTGSGKTLAFLLPCLSQILNQPSPQPNNPHKKPRHKNSQPRILVVCPTRELVEQVSQDAIKLVKHTKGIRVASVIGGMPYGKQLAALKGATLVVATPGRLLDLAERNQVNLTGVQHLVLDEADRMLDLGFSEDLAKIAQLTQKREQTLLFSATFADNIVNLAKSFMQNPQRIELSNSQNSHSDISQSLYWADDQNHKEALLCHWLQQAHVKQAVIFVSTQVETETLAAHLTQKGYQAIALHGAMPQNARMRRLKSLRSGRAKILVATDVAARGLDVPNISHVINYGLPMRHEDYVHRIGRTGRAGRKGTAITVAMHKERGKVRALQQFLTRDIEVLEVVGLEPNPKLANKPTFKKRRRKPANSQRSKRQNRQQTDGFNANKKQPSSPHYKHNRATQKKADVLQTNKQGKPNHTKKPHKPNTDDTVAKKPYAKKYTKNHNHSDVGGKKRYGKHHKAFTDNSLNDNSLYAGKVHHRKKRQRKES